MEELVEEIAELVRLEPDAGGPLLLGHRELQHVLEEVRPWAGREPLQPRCRDDELAAAGIELARRRLDTAVPTVNPGVDRAASARAASPRPG